MYHTDPIYLCNAGVCLCFLRNTEPKQENYRKDTLFFLSKTEFLEA